jgi:hypothetical protein
MEDTIDIESFQRWIVLSHCCCHLFRHDIAVPAGKHSNRPSFSNCFSHPIISYLPSTSASILFAAVYGWELSGARCLEAPYEYRASLSMKPKHAWLRGWFANDAAVL